ncbi:MAG: hypothetical protein RIS79_3877 [Verrucomicrobiota bacterium]|jgi:hypothetical protein
MKAVLRLALLLFACLGLSGCQLFSTAINAALRLWPFLLVESQGGKSGADVETRAGRIQNAPSYEGRSSLPRRIAVENIANR